MPGVHVRNQEICNYVGEQVCSKVASVTEDGSAHHLPPRILQTVDSGNEHLTATRDCRSNMKQFLT